MSSAVQKTSLKIIEQVTSAKSLGVYVYQNINWECHIENISRKIACAIGAIKRIRLLTPFNVLIKVYNSLIQPHFDYCNVVWGNCNKGLFEKLQRLQNRAARILMSASYDSNLDDLFRALGWRRLYYQRLEQKSILMYKTLHGNIENINVSPLSLQSSSAKLCHIINYLSITARFGIHVENLKHRSSCIHHARQPGYTWAFPLEIGRKLSLTFI